MATENINTYDTTIDVDPEALYGVSNTESVIVPTGYEDNTDTYLYGYGGEQESNQDAPYSLSSDGSVIVPAGYEGADIYGFGYGDAQDTLTQTLSISNPSPKKPPLGKDWRVRISVNNMELLGDKDGILGPLIPTGGVVFPYNPEIQIAHIANYANTSLTHVNYQYPQYVNSEVQPITINATFTAQDTTEARYVQAVLHFFKTWTKMFYGNSKYKGSPPPICYLSGYGEYQFNRHPILIQSFSYSYPTDVDYISVTPVTSSLGEQLPVSRSTPNSTSPSGRRLMNSGIQFGGKSNDTVWSNNSTQHNSSSRIPTKLSIDLRCMPLVTRNTISNKWNFADYASGKLTKSGIW